MTGKSFSLGMVAGLLLGAAAAVGLSGIMAAPRVMAQAQPQAQPTAQRYQIANWVHPSSALPASHGAYILDTQTGQVWHIVEDGKLKSIGGVE
jgi:hypothetical protein